VWQMKEAGLDYSCYYHIRDYYVAKEQFTPFMSERGAAFMARWWDRMPQFDGLFDYQNTIRPAYFAFKLLSRLAGERLKVTTDSQSVHAFAADDPELRMQNVVLWNYSREPVEVTLHFDHLQKDPRTRHIVLDANAASGDENARLRPEPFKTIKRDAASVTLQLEPYAIHYWSFE
jgi:hypothetical protein